MARDTASLVDKNEPAAASASYLHFSPLCYHSARKNLSLVHNIFLSLQWWFCLVKSKPVRRSPGGVFSPTSDHPKLSSVNEAGPSLTCVKKRAEGSHIHHNGTPAASNLITRITEDAFSAFSYDFLALMHRA